MFFLFLGKNFLEKRIFYFRIFFQVQYGDTNLAFFNLSFWPMYIKVEGDFLDQFLGCERSTNNTWVNMVLAILDIIWKK